MISDHACDATATGTQIEDTDNIKMETTTPYNSKCTIELWWTVQVGQKFETELVDLHPPLLEDVDRTLLTTPKKQKLVLCLIQYELLCSVGLSI